MTGIPFSVSTRAPSARQDGAVVLTPTKGAAVALTAEEARELQRAILSAVVQVERGGRAVVAKAKTTAARAGISLAEVTTGPALMVGAELVRRVGGSRPALVFALIDDEASRQDAVDGAQWWTATYAHMAERTGLPVGQVRRAVEKLIAGGFVRATRAGGLTRTLSFATLTEVDR